MFTMNPILLGISLTGGVFFYAFLQKPKRFFKNLLFFLLIFILIALSNPLFSHNGATILFYMNGNPVTYESIANGICIAAMIIAVVYWCKCYNEVVTSDKFLYLFGKIIPKIALVLTMALRLIPLFTEQVKKTQNVQEAMGIYPGKSYSDKIKRGTRVFSSVMTWALENSIDTGNSMKARGYGLKGRSNYSIYKFAGADLFFTVMNILFAAVILAVILAGIGSGLGNGLGTFNFYPEVSTIPFGILSAAAYASFAVICFLPAFIEIREIIKWKYLMSKI